MTAQGAIHVMEGGGQNINLSVTTEGIDKPTWWVIRFQILTGASIFLFATAFELALELTQNPVQCFRVLCLGHEGDHSLLSCANFKNVLSYSALSAWLGASLSIGISSGVCLNFLDAVWPTLSIFKQRVCGQFHHLLGRLYEIRRVAFCGGCLFFWRWLLAVVLQERCFCRSTWGLK